MKKKTQKNKKPEPLLYELCDTAFDLTNLMHLSCPAVVLETMKAKPAPERYSLVTRQRLSESSSARQPCMGPGLPQKRLPVKDLSIASSDFVTRVFFTVGL
jgi:hypothetical protein